MIESLYLYISKIFFNLPSLLNNNLPGYNKIVLKLFSSLQTLIKNTQDNLLVISLQGFCLYSLAALTVFFLYIVFCKFTSYI